jgi:hypothetical protein
MTRRAAGDSNSGPPSPSQRGEDVVRSKGLFESRPSTARLCLSWGKLVESSHFHTHSGFRAGSNPFCSANQSDGCGILRNTARYGPSKARILFGYLEFLAGTSLRPRLPRERPASEEKTLRGSDELQSPVRVTEPGAELQQQCQDHKEDYQLGAFDQSRRVVDELRTAALERCGGGQEHRNIQIPAAGEVQSREIKLRAPPADPYYHGDFHDAVRAKVQDPAEQGRRRELACDRAIDGIEKRACSKQQNSSDRRAAGEGEWRAQAIFGQTYTTRLQAQASTARTLQRLPP